MVIFGRDVEISSKNFIPLNEVFLLFVYSSFRLVK